MGLLRDRQRDPSGGQQLYALNAQTQGVHGELGVVAVGGDEFGPVVVRTGLTGHRGLLPAQVTQESIGGELRDEPVCICHQFGPGIVAVHDLLVRHEEK